VAQTSPTTAGPARSAQWRSCAISGGERQLAVDAAKLEDALHLGRSAQQHQAIGAIVLPLTGGWTALQRWMARGPGSPADSQRPTDDTTGARRRLLPIGAFVVAGVIWFMVIIGWLGNLL
jgi:hypothetical protein